jgi:hypothetical protein
MLIAFLGFLYLSLSLFGPASLYARADAQATAPVDAQASGPTEAIDDFLASEQVVFQSRSGLQVLDATAAHLNEIFEAYVPALDSSSQIVSPKLVSGPADAPRLQLGIQACVFIICRTVDLDATITIQSVSGSCETNLLLTADLTRSTDILSNSYDRLNVNICLNPQTGGSQYDLSVSASAHKALSYNSGIYSSNDLRFLKLQTNPILHALNQTLIENGGENLSVVSTQ